MMGRPRTRQDANGNWWCYLCKTHKPLSDFHACKSKFPKPQSSCKGCSKLRDVYNRP